MEMMTWWERYRWRKQQKKSMYSLQRYETQIARMKRKIRQHPRINNEVISEVDNLPLYLPRKYAFREGWKRQRRMRKMLKKMLGKSYKNFHKMGKLTEAVPKTKDEGWAADTHYEKIRKEFTKQAYINNDEFIKAQQLPLKMPTDVEFINHLRAFYEENAPILPKVSVSDFLKIRKTKAKAVQEEDEKEEELIEVKVRLTKEEKRLDRLEKHYETMYLRDYVEAERGEMYLKNMEKILGIEKDDISDEELEAQIFSLRDYSLEIESQERNLFKRLWNRIRNKK